MKKYYTAGNGVQTKEEKVCTEYRRPGVIPDKIPDKAIELVRNIDQNHRKIYLCKNFALDCIRMY